MTVRVLYIDDDAGLGRLLQKAMAAHGFDVHHVATGAEGLERLAAGGFDVIALDHNLVNETGLDVLARLSTLEERPPVIYVTGSEDARTAMAALKAGAVDYVWKDVQGHYRELLAEAMRAALEKERFKREKDVALRQLTEAKERAEIMMGEVNHRVANSLALIASLARMQANAVTDESARDALTEMQARVRAIAGVHRRLYTSPDVRVVKFDEYLRGLIDELEVALDGNKRHTMTLDAAPAMVLTDRVVSLGVLLTELITNAYKYAYHRNRSGEIRVKLEPASDDRFKLSVADDGIGWTGQGDASGTGLGTRIIQAMASTLHSQIVYEPVARGTCISMTFDPAGQ